MRYLLCLVLLLCALPARAQEPPLRASLVVRGSEVIQGETISASAAAFVDAATAVTFILVPPEGISEVAQEVLPGRCVFLFPASRCTAGVALDAPAIVWYTLHVADDAPLGAAELRLSVQDDRGNWVRQAVAIRINSTQRGLPTLRVFAPLATK